MSMIASINSLPKKTIAAGMIFFILSVCIYSVRTTVYAEVSVDPEIVVTEPVMVQETITTTTEIDETPVVTETENVLPQGDEIPEDVPTPMLLATESSESVVTIHAHAIVCDNESDLPDWATGGSPITETTATTWVAAHEHCNFASGWNFEWGLSDAFDPGDTLRGAAGAPWTTFGPTDVNGHTSATISSSLLFESTHLWFREVLPLGYIPFTHDTHSNTNADTHSAELYCHTDVLNYDNRDRIDDVTENATYYCVAWNVREVTSPVCSVTLMSGTDVNPIDAIDDATTVVEKDGALAKILSFVSPRWTANIPGASWIWGDDPVASPVDGVSQTFERTFGWNGPVTEAILSVAADDVYTSWINSAVSGEDLNVANFKSTTQDEYDVTSLIAQGNNILKFQVANDVNNTDPAKNPSGLLYKLVVTGTDPACNVPYEPVVYGCTHEGASNYDPKATRDDESCIFEPMYTIFGYAWHDQNSNDIWEGYDTEEEQALTEGSLRGWGVSITNGTTTYHTVTDENGYYAFVVPAGTWTITEDGVDGWEVTYPNALSHVVTVPAPSAEEMSFIKSIQNLLVPTAYAQVPTTYGPYNFGNSEVSSSSVGSGGGHRRSARTNNMVSEVDVTPRGEVLGESISMIPVGAPHTGAGGAAGEKTLPTTFALLGIAVSLGLVRATRNVY